MRCEKCHKIKYFKGEGLCFKCKEYEGHEKPKEELRRVDGEKKVYTEDGYLKL